MTLITFGNVVGHKPPTRSIKCCMYIMYPSPFYIDLGHSWKLMLNLSTLLMTPSCHDVSLPCPLGIWGAHRQDCSNYLEAYRTEADIDCHSKGWISDIVLLDAFPIFPLVIFLTCHQCSGHHLGMKGMTCFILWAVLLQSLRKGPRSSDQKTLLQEESTFP